jgi:hypothetical protein
VLRDGWSLEQSGKHPEKAHLVYPLTSLATWPTPASYWNFPGPVAPAVSDCRLCFHNRILDGRTVIRSDSYRNAAAE